MAKKRQKPDENMPESGIFPRFVADPPPLFAPEPSIDLFSVPPEPLVEPEPVGLRCRECGCADFKVYRTVPARNGKIRRERHCRHCGKSIVTYEQEAFTQ